MTGPDQTTEARLRALFHDAALRIHPTRPAPYPGTAPPPVHRRARLRLTIGLAVCVVVAGLITAEVRPWAGSGGVGLGSGTGPPGVLLTVTSDGAVELLAPETGAVLRTLVGPSPVDGSGRHLSRPYGVTAADQVAYVGYLGPSPVIESIPFAGGTPRYVTDGVLPSANPDGTELAFESAGTSTGAVVVRDLASGSQQTVYPSGTGASGISLVEGLSWSSDGEHLAIGGLFTSPVPGGTPPLAVDLSTGAELLTLGSPLSATNPHFLGTTTTFAGHSPETSSWTDAQFVGPGDDVAVVAGPSSGACGAAVPTSVLSVDPTTGRTTPVASFAFAIMNPVFDQRGDLVAFTRDFPQTCPPVTTITTTTTTTIARAFSGKVSVSGGGTFYAVPARTVLYRWSDGTASRLAPDIAAVTFVPQASDGLSGAAAGNQSGSGTTSTGAGGG